jgi:hypothetical protein
LRTAGDSSLRQRPPKSICPDQCFATIIASKLIKHFSDERRAGTILSSDLPEIVTGLIPFLGRMLVLLRVYKTRDTDERLSGQIWNIAHYAQRLAAFWRSHTGR